MAKSCENWAIEGIRGEEIDRAYLHHLDDEIK